MRLILIAIGAVVGVIAGFVVGMAFGAFGMHFLMTPRMEPRINFQTIYFPGTETRIHTVARVWGLTGDHEEVKFCSEPVKLDQRNQADKCIVLHTARVFYEKDGATKLRIYAPSSSIPPNVKTSLGPITVSIRELKTFDDINEFERNFETYGLVSIAAP
jgi:hypothetical protein